MFEFRIRDTGIGMSKDFQKTIFDAFTREKTSTVSGIQGTCLGMAITRSIVERHDLHEQGRGKWHRVHRHVALSSERKRRTDRYRSGAQGLRILVEDDDTCLSVFSMLRSLGVWPDWTGLGKEAVIRAKEAVKQSEAFSAYIIDWQIPDLNGIEVIRRTRSQIGIKAPIIILTAYDGSDIETEAREAGVTAFCSKPIFLLELRKVLPAPL